MIYLYHTLWVGSYAGRIIRLPVTYTVVFSHWLPPSRPNVFKCNPLTLPHPTTHMPTLTTYSIFLQLHTRLRELCLLRVHTSSPATILWTHSTVLEETGAVYLSCEPDNWANCQYLTHETIIIITVHVYSVKYIWLTHSMRTTQDYGLVTVLLCNLILHVTTYINSIHCAWFDKWLSQILCHSTRDSPLNFDLTGAVSSRPIYVV